MLSYIEISKDNLVHNFNLIKAMVRPDVKMACVIKANAYGHGQNEIAKALENHADYFQVDDFQELKLLREVSEKPALVLGYVSNDEIAEALSLGGILSAYENQQISNINEQAKKLGVVAKIHIKIDAALGRQGVLVEDVKKIVDFVKSCENIFVEAIYSHFANIEDTSDFSHAQKQIDFFKNALAVFHENGYSDLMTHMSASSGIMVYESNGGVSDIVRPGISLYGMWPSEDLENRFKNSEVYLKPVLKWITHVAQIKTVPADYSIGYGLTYITTKPTKIAIIPQGYSDGFDRGLSNTGEVLIGNSRCKVLGRVAMNMFAVDVSHLSDVKAEDEVVLLGRQGEEIISAEEIANKIGTINYEITTRISPLLPRVLV